MRDDPATSFDGVMHCPAEKEQTYRIIRFWKDWSRESEIIATGLTLEEARAHCQDDATHGDGWFDGYDYDE